MRFFDNEVPSGIINGVNAVFTLAATPEPVDSLILIRNGVMQIRGVDFNISGNVITFINIPQTGDYLRAWYRSSPSVELTAGGIYRDEAVSLIMDRLGMRTGLETLIIRHMQHVQSMLESKPTLPWFLVRTSDVNVNGPYITVPVDMIREVDDVNALWLLKPGTHKALEKMDYDVLATSEVFTGTGEPVAYASYGNRLYLFPVPSHTVETRLLYYGSEPTLSSNIKNGWLVYASKLVISETGLSVARTLRDHEQANLFAMEAREAWADLIRSNTARLVAALRSSVSDYTA